MKLERDSATITVSWDELEILNNALNEVLHALDIPEFATRIGADKPEVLKLLHYVADTWHKLNSR